MDNENMNDIFNEDWPEDHRSGVIAVVGRPNVGKSTLINRILGQKIAIVTNKPQTTRKQQLGIFTTETAQALLVDTPGLHKPHNKLGEYMITAAENALRDADVILWVMDVSIPPSEGDHYIAETLTKLGGDTPIMLALNKNDLVDPNHNISAHLRLVKHIGVFRISAMDGQGVAELIESLTAELPLGPRYYPADQVSEVNMRFIAAEAIREKIIIHTQEEIPYSVAVEITEFKERSEEMTYISATIYVERDSQKGIIIGKGGEMIKKIGSEARVELAKTLGTGVFLDLHAKVLKNWRSSGTLLRRLGYFVPREENS